MSKYSQKAYVSPVSRAQETWKIAMTEIDNLNAISAQYTMRVRDALFSGNKTYFPEDIHEVWKEKREKQLPEPKFVTDFLRWKRAYFDERQREVRCSPINIARPFLLDMQKIFKRVVEAKNPEITTIVASRHWEKEWTNWELTDRWRAQAQQLWKKLANISKNSDNYYIYIFWHNTYFESIALSLYFWKRYGLNTKDPELMKKRNKEFFPHNDSDIFSNFDETTYRALWDSDTHSKEVVALQKDMEALESDYHSLKNESNNMDKYFDKDWTKMLEFTESISFTFYPPQKDKPPYMEIDWRGLKEEISYKEFNQIIDSLHK